MKIGKFVSFDPELKKRGTIGLVFTSKLDDNFRLGRGGYIPN